MKKIYCAACNQVFETADHRCPRCGLAILTSADDSGLQSTVDGIAEAISGDESNLSHDEIDRAASLPSLIGRILHIYQCERMLGRGGMGAVYLARNQQLHRLVALKVLFPQRAFSDTEYLERFENEGRAAAALVHPNVVTTHAIGKVDSHHFLEMEYVAGHSLQNEIDLCGPLGPIRSTGMAVGISSGLTAAHRLGIVHRDLKPDNILVTASGSPKIADFGLAKRIRASELPTSKLAGTPHYMAPELLHGQPATPASDVFALGVCFYQMLTGYYPFYDDSLSSLFARISSGDYISVRRRNPEVPLDVAECVAMFLASDPAQRPRDGAAASQLLQAVMGAVRDLDVLVYEAFQGVSSIRYTPDNDRFRVELSLRNSRHQVVYVENSDHGADERLLLIYSVCCPSNADFYENALRLNANMHHGGLSIRDIDGRPYFVMVDTYPRATVSAEDIRRSVLEIGIRADSVEQMLTGRDIN